VFGDFHISGRAAVVQSVEQKQYSRNNTDMYWTEGNVQFMTLKIQLLQNFSKKGKENLKCVLKADILQNIKQKRNDLKKINVQFLQVLKIKCEIII
jgi:hypothetical protein